MTPPRTMRVSLLALGCKTNQEEMECLGSRLSEGGCRIVPFGEPADWVVVNTCTVTASGDSDSRQMVRRALRGKGEGRLIVTGCLAQRDPQTFLSMEGVDWIVGNGEKARLGDWIREAVRSPRGAGAAEARLRRTEDPTVSTFPSFGRGREGRRTRATLKIQDGCRESCTYCVIPAVRGASRSRPLAEVLEQGRILCGSGYREIALTGINTAVWGRDLPGGMELPDLLEALQGVEGLERIRLNSLEPQYVTPEWVERLSLLPSLCRHFHLPLQSGDARVLRRMGRRYSPEQYADTVRALCRSMPDAAVGADLLVGFPGETEEEFEGSLALLESLPLAYLHVFTYSPRPGTAALRLSQATPSRVARGRSQRLRRLDQTLRREFARAQLRSVQSVIPESPSGPGIWQGLTGNYLRAHFPWTPGEGAAPSLLVVLREMDGEGRILAETLAGARPPEGSAG